MATEAGICIRVLRLFSFADAVQSEGRQAACTFIAMLKAERRG
jgi:hypothetical protein